MSIDTHSINIINRYKWQWVENTEVDLKLINLTETLLALKLIPLTLLALLCIMGLWFIPLVT